MARIVRRGIDAPENAEPVEAGRARSPIGGAS
jgi:hypothetical protein